VHFAIYLCLLIYLLNLTTLYFNAHILVSKVYAVIFRSTIKRLSSVWTAWGGKLARRSACYHAMAWVATRQVMCVLGLCNTEEHL